MRVTSLTTVPVSVPLREDRVITSSRGTHAESPFALVLMEAGGVVGLGEVSATPRWSGEDGVTAKHIIDRYLAPVVVGMDPREPVRLAQAIESCVAGHHFTKAAVEMAAWDILGKVLDAPVHRLLGGPVRDEVRTKFSISAGPPELIGASAAWASGAGFNALKIKVARGSLDQDLRCLAAAQEAAGPEVAIGVDANGGWTRADAFRNADALVSAGAAFVEQPLPASDLEGMAMIRARLSVPLVADEAVGTARDAERVIRAGAADVLSIYVGMAGGISGAMEIAAMAHGAGLGWTIGSNLEMGVATAAQMQIAFAGRGLDDLRVPCDIISPFYYEADLLTTPLPVRAGSVLPTQGPGLGVELDQRMVERFKATADSSKLNGL